MREESIHFIAIANGCISCLVLSIVAIGLSLSGLFWRFWPRAGFGPSGVGSESFADLEQGIDRIEAIFFGVAPSGRPPLEMEVFGHELVNAAECFRAWRGLGTMNTFVSQIFMRQATAYCFARGSP